MLNVCRGAFARAVVVTGLFSVVAVVSSQPVAAAVADKVKLVDIPLAETILNPCTNELVSIVGTTNLTLYTRVQRTGALVVTLRIRMTGDGTAQSAFGGGIVPYRFHSEELTRTRDLPSGAFELAALARTSLYRKGELGQDVVTQDDWIFKHTIRVKQDEFGNVTATREYTADSCPVG